MINSFLDMRAKRGPLGFLIAMVVICAVTILCIQGIYAWLHSNHHLSGLIIFLGILCVVFGGSILLTQVIRRLNDMGWNGMYSLLIFLAIGIFTYLGLRHPTLSGVNVPALIVVGVLLAPLCVLPGKSRH